MRNLLKTHWKQQDAAFIVYHHPKDKSWRFSYVSELKTFNEAGEYVDNKTEPKRYTYVLGENESCRTAAIQFSKLQDKASNATLDDIKEAFSVEKMSKDFFDTYKDHYQDFVQYLTGKRLEKVAGKWEEVVKHAPNTQLITIFNNNEKDVRDFCKKLLGRIVFLYFIQKKGWLGVPLHDKWGNGKPDFISRLLANCRNPSIFYSEYLSKLFFETLNQARPDDLAEIIPGEKTRVPYLNGGLFEEDDPNQRGLIFEEELFKNLFAFFDQYNFTIYEDDPNDHTVAVDPEMLGHIFENLLEDNKDKGAFYTPKEIVHYMCQESLIEYLTTWFEGKNYQVQQDTFISFDNAQQASFISANEGRNGQGVLEVAQPAQTNSKVINRSLIEKLLKKQLSDEDKQAVIEHAAEFNEALDKVKICDPAIGSGAFPMGLLLEIFTAKQAIYSFTHDDLTTFEPAKVKLNIIQNSIYGVDIERGAVDIARLRFWLSLVVDEPEPQPLPNLDYKIVVGNSLISKLGDDVIEIDWDIKPNNHGLFGAEEAKNIQSILKQLSNLQKDFFNPTARKKSHATEIRDLKIKLLINQLNLMIESQGLKQPPRKTATLSPKSFVAQTQLYLQTLGWQNQLVKLEKLKITPSLGLDFFDWQLNFAEIMNKEVTGKVGFDIVIGNPPYVQLQKMFGSEIFGKLNYQTYTKSADLYCLFYERGINLLKSKGNLCFITSNSWLRTKYGYELRKFFIENSNPILLINFEDVQIFQTAIVESNIILVTKATFNENLRAISIGNDLNSNSSISDYVSSKTISISELDENGWVIGSKLSNSLKKKIEFSSIALGKLPYKIMSGVKTGFNEAFLINEAEKTKLLEENQGISSLVVPLLRGRDIKKYNYEFNEIYLINTHNGLKSKNIKPIDVSKDYPELLKYFDKFSNKLKTRPSQGAHWTNTPATYSDEYKKAKIIWGELSDEAKFTYDDSGIYVEATVFLMTGKNLKYILSIFNSRLAQWYFEQIATSSGMGTNRWKKYKIEQFPIKVVSEVVVQKFEALVTKILDCKKGGLATSDIEQKLDGMVFKLYNLAFDEVKLIDSDFVLSEAEYKAIVI